MRRYYSYPWIFSVRRLVHKPEVCDWCRLPYPGHPKGCPNYGKQIKCPPQAPYVTEVFDTSRPLYLVHSEFDLTGHINRMQELHPSWSAKQLRCVLYWQNSSRKQLRERVSLAMNILGTTVYHTMAEALGVNLYATCQLSGLKLEKIKDLKTNRHVALLGYGI